MKQIVGVSDMKLSSNPEETVVTFALGSCIGVVLYDPVVKVGGILHYMLPQSKIDLKKAEKNPFMFGDTGIPEFFRRAYKLGAEKKRIRIVIVGGAAVLDIKDRFNIGKRNITIARKLFWKNGIIIDGENIGGSISRTLYLDMASGDTWFTNKGEKVVV